LRAGGLSLPLLGSAVGVLLPVFGLLWASFEIPAAIGHHRSLPSMLARRYGHHVQWARVPAHEASELTHRILSQ
jgi:hypothetical protein